MTIEVSNWFWEGVMMQGGVLSIDPAYFDLTGGLERWLYRVARKHAGGAGEVGFAIAMPTLFEKSGAKGQYRRFKFEIAKIVERNGLPGCRAAGLPGCRAAGLALETPAGKREPLLRMQRRSDVERPMKTVVAHGAGGAKAPARSTSTNPTATANDADETIDVTALLRRSRTSLATRATAGEITDATMATLCRECPGWDYQTLHDQFRAWVEADSTHTPVSYQAAFIGFVRRYHEKHRHELGR
jgi:plasmid replication initiation protein